MIFLCKVIALWRWPRVLLGRGQKALAADDVARVPRRRRIRASTSCRGGAARSSHRASVAVASRLSESSDRRKAPVAFLVPINGLSSLRTGDSDFGGFRDPDHCSSYSSVHKNNPSGIEVGDRTEVVGSSNDVITGGIAGDSPGGEVTVFCSRSGYSEECAYS